LILDQLPSEGQTVSKKLESYTEQVGFAVVLATPDDERPSIVLGLGMLCSKRGRKRGASLLKPQDRMERPSDIQGLISIPFKDEVKDARVPLAKEIGAQGYNIDLSRL
jgi:predicted nucleotide-binding protein